MFEINWNKIKKNYIITIFYLTIYTKKFMNNNIRK